VFCSLVGGLYNGGGVWGGGGCRCSVWCVCDIGGGCLGGRAVAVLGLLVIVGVGVWITPLGGSVSTSQNKAEKRG